MRFSPRHLFLGGLLLAATAGAVGCTGVNHTHSVSPLDFLLPGAGFLKTEPPKPAPDTGSPAAPVAPEVVSLR
jgi:hypothetical protein